MKRSLVALVALVPLAAGFTTPSSVPMQGMHTRSALSAAAVVCFARCHVWRATGPTVDGLAPYASRDSRCAKAGRLHHACPRAQIDNPFPC